MGVSKPASLAAKVARMKSPQWLFFQTGFTALLGMRWISRTSIASLPRAISSGCPRSTKGVTVAKKLFFDSVGSRDPGTAWPRVQAK